MKLETLFEKGEHKWIFIGRSDHADERLIDTNQYAIVVKDHILLMDPGGAEIFPPVMTTLSSVVDIKNIKYIFCSHQDPDIISSIPLWMALCPKANLYASWLWKGFLAHYGGEFVNNYMAISDNGMSLELGHQQILLVPSHYCHSPGNFSLFDPEARILFSGDIGGAVIKSSYPLFCENFDEHVKVMESFHKRVMPSNNALMKWVKTVRRLNPAMICPQHGSIIKGEKMVSEFLNWLYDLEVGVY